LQEDLRAGQICATVANYAGKTRKSDARMVCPSDFMPALPQPEHKETSSKEGGILLSNPIEQANLIAKVIFKRPEK